MKRATEHGDELSCPCIKAERPRCGNPLCWHFGYHNQVCKACNNTGREIKRKVKR